MANLYRQFLSILPDDPLLVGTVTDVFADNMADVQLIGGGKIRVSGEASVDDKVFVKGGLIIDKAPDLPLVNVTIY